MVSLAIVIGTHRNSLVQDQDTPGDGPLLQADQASTLGGRHALADVNWYLCGLDTDTNTVDDSSDDQHGNVLRCADDDGADDPDDAADHD